MLALAPFLAILNSFSTVFGPFFFFFLGGGFVVVVVVFVVVVVGVVVGVGVGAGVGVGVGVGIGIGVGVGVVVVVWHHPITGSEVPGNIGAPFAVPLREQKVGGMPPQRLAP